MCVKSLHIAMEYCVALFLNGPDDIVILHSFFVNAEIH